MIEAIRNPIRQPVPETVVLPSLSNRTNQYGEALNRKNVEKCV